MIFLVRSNGVGRLLYLGIIHFVLPLFEPLRDLAIKFLKFSFRKKVFVGLFAFAAVIALIYVFGLELYLPIFLFLFLAIAFFAVFKLGIYPIFRFLYLKVNKDRLIKSWSSRNYVSLSDLGFSQGDLDILRAEIEKSGQAVIADIDKDGFILPRYKEFSGENFVNQEEFIPRKRNKIQLVAIGDKVGVKKPAATVKAFLTEIDSMLTLRDGVNVPAILDIDFETYSIVSSYIPGVVLREELAKRGAKLRHRDIDHMPEYRELSRRDRKRKIIKATRPVLNDYLSFEMKEAIFSELQKIHRKGVLVNDIKYGNIIIDQDSNQPYFIDFDFSKKIGYPRGFYGDFKRDSEIELFNYLFVTKKPTRKKLLLDLEDLEQIIPGDSKVSVNFGHGIVFGRTWDVSFGEGLWHYMIDPYLPDLCGLRILDISNLDPLFSIRMLIKGAAEVVRIRGTGKWDQYTQFLKEGFEWSNSMSLNLIVEESSSAELDRKIDDPFDLIFSGDDIFKFQEQAFEELIKLFRSLGVKSIVSCVDYPDEGLIKDQGKTSIKSSFDILKHNGFSIHDSILKMGSNQQLMVFKAQ